MLKQYSAWKYYNDEKYLDLKKEKSPESIFWFQRLELVILTGSRELHSK